GGAVCDRQVRCRAVVEFRLPQVGVVVGVEVDLAQHRPQLEVLGGAGPVVGGAVAGDGPDQGGDDAARGRLEVTGSAGPGQVPGCLLPAAVDAGPGLLAVHDELACPRLGGLVEIAGGRGLLGGVEEVLEDVVDPVGELVVALDQGPQPVPGAPARAGLLSWHEVRPDQLGQVVVLQL